MEIESTTSQSLQNGFAAINSTTNNKYMINTAKAMKGHKLTTRDFVKLQLMKFRQCSPVKYEDIISSQLANS